MQTTNNMINMLIRSFIIYVIVLIAIRLMGKRQIGEMQPFELVITLIIAELACIPMAELAVPLSHGLVPIAVLLIMHYLICLISRKSMTARYILSGRPAIVVSPQGINYNELKRLNMTLDDLIEALRGCNYFCFDDVAYAVIETNGTMCVLPKQQSSPLTCGAMKIKGEQASLPMSIIMDGKLMHENIRISGFDDKYIAESMKKLDINNYKKVILLTVETSGKVFIQPKHGECRSFQTSYDGSGKW